MKNKNKENGTAIVNDLKALIKKNRWENDFKKAITEVHEYDLPIIGGISNLEEYYKYLEGFVHWTPKETKDDPRLVYDHLVAFYFFMQRPSLRKHQSPITPHKPKKVGELTELVQVDSEMRQNLGRVP